MSRRKLQGHKSALSIVVCGGSFFFGGLNTPPGVLYSEHGGAGDATNVVMMIKLLSDFKPPVSHEIAVRPCFPHTFYAIHPSMICS